MSLTKEMIKFKIEVKVLQGNQGSEYFIVGHIVNEFTGMIWTSNMMMCKQTTFDKCND